MAKLKIAHALNGGVLDKYTGPTTISGNYLGATGGLTSVAGNQIQPAVKIGAASAGNGSIKAQKGSRKFLVTDGTNTGICTLVNKASGSLAANEMSITVTKADASTFYAKRITNRWVWDFNDNKYRYWTAAATTSNKYATDAAAGVTGFVQVASA